MLDGREGDGGLGRSQPLKPTLIEVVTHMRHVIQSVCIGSLNLGVILYPFVYLLYNFRHTIVRITKLD